MKESVPYGSFTIKPPCSPACISLPGVAWVRNRAQPCSYWEYIGKRKTECVHPEEVLKFFSKKNPKLSYENFVKQEEDFGVINKIRLEE